MRSSRRQDASQLQPEWYRAALASIGEGVIATDAAGRVVFVNAVGEAVSGWTHELAAGLPLDEVFRVVDEGSRKPIESLAASALRLGGVVSRGGRALLVTRHGSERPIDESAAPILDAAGRVAGAVVVFRDAGERRERERLLRESEARKAANLRAALDCVITIDERGRILDWNPAAERTFGHARDAVMGREMADLIIPTALRERHRAALARYLGTGQSAILDRRVELEGLRADGSLFPVELTVTRIAIEGPPAFNAYVRDITERRRLEQHAREQAEALADLHRRKDEFLAMLGHELRNPLAPIANALQLLRLEQASESATQRQARGIIERQLAQLKRLVDDLLEVSRITTDRIQLSREPHDLRAIAAGAIETARPLIERRRHVLTVSLPPQPIWLFADAVRLEQVVVNLLNNAAKYTNEGGCVSLVIERTGGEAVLRVSDTGVGIAPELLPRIFDLFTQAERSVQRSQGGLGIGLSLVQRLVEMHQGKVEAHSVVGQGSEFVVRLPVMPAYTPVRPPTVDGPLPRAERPLRVLVVDDNLDTAESLALLLGAAGHDVRIAHDGPSALASARELHPDAVLLDIALPGMNGYAVAEHMRQTPELRDALLVAVTGYGQDTDRALSEKAGFDEHLVKPPDLDRVQRMLSAFAERRVRR